MRVDRQNLRENCDFTCAADQPFRTKWGSIVKLRKNCDFTCAGARSNTFARNEGRSSKIDVKLRFYLCSKRGSMRKNWGKIAILLVLEQPFRTKWGSIVKNCGKIAILLVPEQPFRTKWGSMRKNWCKIAILLVPDLSWSNPFARNEVRCAKTEVKLRFYLCRTCPGATLSHEMRDAQKRR